MTPIEIIARYLCKEAGFHPDGTYGEEDCRHWESYERDAGDIINALEVAGFTLVGTHTQKEPAPLVHIGRDDQVHHGPRAECQKCTLADV